MLIDAHAHIFPEVRGRTRQGETHGTGLGRIQEGDETIQLLPPYGTETLFTPEMLIANLDWAGVDRAILLQGPFYGECNQYALDAIRAYPNRLSGLAYFDPWDGDGDGHAALERILQARLFKGVKLECSVPTGLTGLHPQARLGAPEIAWIWAALESHRQVLVLDLGAPGTASYQTQAVRQIAEAHPRLKIIIAHLGQPKPGVESDPELMQLWQEQIKLAELPNIWFDCASLPAFYPGEEYPFPTAGCYLRSVIEQLGAAKILWGTDQPGLLSSASLPQLAKLIRRHLAFLPAEDQDKILGGNAARIYGL